MERVAEGSGRARRRGARAFGAALLLVAALLGAPAGAAERFGLVGAVDRAGRTMTIDGEVYGVADETEIRGRDGRPLPLSQFPVPGPLEVVAVYYEAEGGHLRSVRITELPR